MIVLSASRPSSRFVEELGVVKPPLSHRFLVLYRAAFTPLERLAPARQGLTDDEFLDQMGDPSVVKFVAWDDSGEPMAMAFMATDLKVVPWISPQYFEARFPEHFARAAVYYFGALLVSPAHRGGRWAFMVLDAAAAMVARNRAVAVFDCCEHNATRRLPELIAMAGRRVGNIDALQLAPQRYYAFAEGIAAPV